MRSTIALTLILLGHAAAQNTGPSRLIVVEPAHFHATLLQADMYPELDPRVSVYSALGPEVVDYLSRIAQYNLRPTRPTSWQLDLHTSDRPMDDMLARERQGGGVVVFSGRNRGKIERMLGAIQLGHSVLADKPWIIRADEMPKLEQAFREARQRRVAIYDIMTERYEVTSQVQRALVNLPSVYGEQVKGDAAHPGVSAYSIHHILKTVAGVPARRPVAFFDVDDYGEGLADVGTHPVDLIQWTLFPEQALDYRRDIRMISGRHDAVRVTREQFQKVTGAADFPVSVQSRVHDGVLDYTCNNYIEYALRGVHVKLDVLWKWEAEPGGGDVYEAKFQGSRARVDLRKQEVYVVPAAGEKDRVYAALKAALAGMQSQFPGIAAEYGATEAHIAIPRAVRIGHEDHFAQVARHFFDYKRNPDSIPAWEEAYMLAKYYVTTQGVALALKH